MVFMHKLLQKTEKQRVLPNSSLAVSNIPIFMEQKKALQENNRTVFFKNTAAKFL